jgi:hypothetical protein
MWLATRAMFSAMFVAAMLFGIASNAQAVDERSGTAGL